MQERPCDGTVPGDVVQRCGGTGRRKETDFYGEKVAQVKKSHQSHGLKRRERSQDSNLV